MAITTVTLTASGRLPGALSAAPSALSLVVIPSGMVGILPMMNSGFTCFSISCQGLDSTLGVTGNRGMLGIPSKRGGATGTIVESGSVSSSKRFCSVDVERVNSGTVTIRGGSL